MTSIDVKGSTTVTRALEFEEDPVKTVCPHCQQQILTRTEYKLGLMSWMLCLCVAICCLCCDFAKDVHHYCPQCGKWLGRYKRDRKECTKYLIGLIAIMAIAALLVSIIQTIFYVALVPKVDQKTLVSLLTPERHGK
uniref:LITAF domain-containing protein n=1 Tax=Acrobeloides nanus TaxID=290746 RepID=A0A914EP27_9BILA